MGLAAGSAGLWFGAAADQREQRRFVLACSPQLWQGVPSF